MTKLQEVHDHEVAEIQLLSTERDAAMERIEEMSSKINTLHTENAQYAEKQDELLRIVAKMKVEYGSLR